MAQHINTNQLHPAMVNQLPMLQAAGLNLTIMTGQQHGLQQFAQGQPGMYQIVQQAPGQLQMQNVVQHQQHQLNNIHQLQQPQHLQQQSQITHQQVQQLNNHHQLNNHTQIQQIQIHQNQQLQQQMHQGGHQDNHQTTKGKKKKPKINKDGVPAPKRATTAYINFTQWYRESIKKTGRTVPKIGEFGKECAGKWNSMNEEEKKPFTEVAARDRDRYRREMEIYKPARDVNKPKRPGTAFMLFMVDFRKEVAGKEPEGGVAALAKLGGERWRNMTDEDKKPYVEQQNECKIKYEQDMEEYRKKNGQMVNAPTPTSEPPKEENTSEINSVADSENSEHQASNLGQNNGNLEHEQQQQNNSPGSTSASPHPQELNQSPGEQQDVAQQQQALDSLAMSEMNMPDFSSNENFNSGFNQQNNTDEPNLYQQQTHDQQGLDQHLDTQQQQQLDQQLNQQQLDQQLNQQDSSQFSQNYNQHYQWN